MRRALLAAGLGAMLLAPGAAAAERTLLVPRITIYPGDEIDDKMLEDKFFPAAPEHNVLSERSEIVGKVAKRTLLPGMPIPAIGVDDRRVVKIGARVRLIFDQNGLSISAYGLALDAGKSGDFIRVRNVDSGLTVSGRVQADGSVRIGEG
jgi:flagella basal body P-ring formation protein FlgA